MTAILHSFAVHVSAVVFRRSIAPDLLFDTSLKCAGEDLVYLAQLCSRTQKIALSASIHVNCGAGINMYFNNLNWSSPGHLGRLADCLRAHSRIKNTIKLTADNAAWNDGYIVKLKRDVVFHTLRTWLRSRGTWPKSARMLAQEDKNFYAWFLAYATRVIFGYVLKTYHPG